jgi:hypothetical protein
MAELICLNTFSDERGKLTVVEKVLPFEIKRVFYIYEVDNCVRGNHRHKRTIQAAICVKGSCTISNYDGIIQQDFLLNGPDKCLILYPEDYHWMHNFESNTVLLVLASEEFNEEDYIYERYK